MMIIFNYKWSYFSFLDDDNLSWSCGLWVTSEVKLTTSDTDIIQSVYEYVYVLIASLMRAMFTVHKQNVLADHHL